jgi:very-short-patch-repair endonuclease
MREEGASRDARVAGIAARQHGVVSISQLHEAGLDHRAVGRRTAAGRLHRIHRGVYAVGHPGLSLRGRWMAATLALGGAAVLSHRSAAALWALLDSPETPIEVCVPGHGGRRRRRGIVVHRSATIEEGMRTRRHGIPVTTPSRTIADLRSSISAAEFRRAVRRAEVSGLATGVDRREPTRSELEELFLRLCMRHRLPAPEVNVRVGSITVDFLWRGRRLIVETDGYRYHRGRQAFEDDHARDLDLRALGFEVRRFTYRQVTGNPGRIAATLREALE